MSSEFKVLHGPITTEKMAKNVWVAKCEVTEPFKSTVTMRGTTEINAIGKLKAFLNNEDYSKIK